MMKLIESVEIVMAEDDPEDQMLVREAFEEAHLVNDFTMVGDGEELMDYLHRRGRYVNAIRPDLILLDLNMPKRDGRQVLAEMKSDPALRSIPVVIMTSSSAEEDILRSYDLGVNSYIQKPVTFDKLVEVIKTLSHYWMEIVALPSHPDRKP